MKKGVTLLLVLFGLFVGTAAVRYAPASDLVEWWSPARSTCPTYNTREACEKAENKTCVKHTGTAAPACLR